MLLTASVLNVQYFNDIFRDAFTDVLVRSVAFLPQLIVALVVFAVGWIIALGVGKVVAKVLQAVRFNQLFEQEGIRTALERADWKVDPAGFVGSIVRWVIVIFFLYSAVVVLGLGQFAEFFREIVLWLPNLVVAAVIFVVAIIVAEYVGKLIRAWIESLRIGYGQFIETVVKGAIWLFAIFAILHQLGIATVIVETIAMGIVAFLVIAGGLAFGLGGKDLATDILREARERVRK